MHIITPPARRTWRSYKFAPFLGFFPVSKVGAPLMGDTAVHSLSHDFKLTQWAKRRRYNVETTSDVSRNDVVKMLKMQIVLASIARRCYNVIKRR